MPRSAIGPCQHRLNNLDRRGASVHLGNFPDTLEILLCFIHFLVLCLSALLADMQIVLFR